MSTRSKAPRGSEPPPLAVQIGDIVLDRYRIVEHIASGGHSVVFRGQDERLSRPVCIKVFSGMGGNSGVGRTSYEHFVQEAFALSRLTHPNTLRIYDFGHLGPKDASGSGLAAEPLGSMTPVGMPLQVCEYMNGGTLSNIVREQGPQSLAETVRIVNAMCLPLAQAHALGIVHRDIKPPNIPVRTVGADPAPKLAPLQPFDAPAAAIDVLSRALAFDPRSRLPRVEDLAQQLAAALAPAEPPKPSDSAASSAASPGHT